MWILIITTVIYGTSVHTHSVEFTSEKNCNTASAIYA